MAEPVYYGVVRGNVIVLPPETHLSDGLRVEIRPLPPSGERADTLLAEERFMQDLLRRGLLTEIRPSAPLSGEEDPIPIEIAGKPLSETIIDERR